MSQLAGSRKASPTSSEESAGAIVSGGRETAAGKIEALKQLASPSPKHPQQSPTFLQLSKCSDAPFIYLESVRQVDRRQQC
jgi:hypothetical protein